MARKQQQESELITVRVPKDLVDLLRLAAQATGATMSDEIRLGIQMRARVIRHDEGIKRRIEERIAELNNLYAVLDANVVDDQTGNVSPVDEASLHQR